MLDRQVAHRAKLARKQITQEEATLEMDCLQAVVTTLKWLERNEDKIRAAAG